MFKKLKKSVAVLVAAAMVAGTAGTLSTTIFADETSGTDSTELTSESSSDVSE